MAFTKIQIKSYTTQLKSAVTGPRGPSGGGGAGSGIDGDDGWSPIFSVITDGQRRVLQVIDWTGGNGTKPTTGLYVGPSGFVSTPGAGVDIRGAIGATGPSGSTGPAGAAGPAGATGAPGAAGSDGDDGWSPVLAVVSDGERRVFQVTDWVGGSGTKPAIGQYVGSTGLVSTLGLAVDVRGPSGPAGSGSGSGTGVDGDDGWSPIFSVVTDGQRRVLRVDDWTGGTGTKPAVNQFVGASGFVATATLAVDIRGATGPAGPTGATGATGAVGPAGPQGIKGDTGNAGPAGATGPAGETGAAGTNGWTPILSIVSDGARRVLRVVDWVGGTGAKPATGQYIGPSGLVTLIGDATDIRGPAGADGSGGSGGGYSLAQLAIDVDALTESTPAAGDFDLALRDGPTPQLIKLPSIAAEVVAARGSRMNLNNRISAVSNVASPNAAPPVVGQFYDNNFHATASGTFPIGANRFHSVPFIVSSRLRIDQLGISVSTLGAGVLARCAIYSADPATYMPAEKLYEGALELDCGSTGFKAHSLDFTFDADRIYWLVVNATGAATIRGIAAGSTIGFGPTGVDATTYKNCFSSTGFSTGSPLPTPNPVTSSDLVSGGTNVPCICMRAAAL